MRKGWSSTSLIALFVVIVTHATGAIAQSANQTGINASNRAFLESISPGGWNLGAHASVGNSALSHDANGISRPSIIIPGNSTYVASPQSVGGSPGLQ